MQEFTKYLRKMILYKFGDNDDAFGLVRFFFSFNHPENVVPMPTSV
jgi:hypothetical protein